jgi:hypothetical protein
MPRERFTSEQVIGKLREAETLLYLYWEPQNFANIPEPVTHGKEVKQLSQNISGSKPKFLAASYRELWDAWMKQKLPVWLTPSCWKP